MAITLANALTVPKMTDSMEVQTARLYYRAVSTTDAKMVLHALLFSAAVNTDTAARALKVTPAQGVRFPPRSLSKRMDSYTSKQPSRTQWHF